MNVQNFLLTLLVGAGALGVLFAFYTLLIELPLHKWRSRRCLKKFGNEVTVSARSIKMALELAGKNFNCFDSDEKMLLHLLEKLLKGLCDQAEGRSKHVVNRFRLANFIEESEESNLLIATEIVWTQRCSSSVSQKGIVLLIKAI